jgi:hypothetical protein
MEQVLELAISTFQHDEGWPTIMTHDVPQNEELF